MSDSDKLKTAIVEAAESNLQNLIALPDGVLFAPGGVNGPYFDVETPVRNTAHWCITYASLAQEFPDKGFADAAHGLIDFLTNPCSYVKNDVYVHRQKHGKDWSNGVIGQAWVIEALAITGRKLKRDDALAQANKAASIFPFDHSVSAWKRIDPRSGKRAIDYTLNHQLWYAAALSELRQPEHDANITSFLDSLHSGGIRTSRDGRILHLLYSNSSKGLLLRLRNFITRKKNGDKLKEKEIGYHLYNLHPLARLRRRFPKHSLFLSQQIKEALEYAISQEFIDELRDNVYAYPYNAPGFEMPVVLYGFCMAHTDIHVCMHQIEKTFEKNNGICGFVNNTGDPVTLNARAYEFFSLV